MCLRAVVLLPWYTKCMVIAMCCHCGCGDLLWEILLGTRILLGYILFDKCFWQPNDHISNCSSNDWDALSKKMVWMLCEYYMNPFIVWTLLFGPAEEHLVCIITAKNAIESLFVGTWPKLNYSRKLVQLKRKQNVCHHILLCCKFRVWTWQFLQ